MKIWQVSPKIKDDFIAAHPDINPVVLQLLHNCGLTDVAAIKLFLDSELPAELSRRIGEPDGPIFYDPFLFKNMAAAAELIISHLKAGNKIMVYGDYDADGVTSSVILLETLKILGGEADVYLPDRVSEGYGLNKEAIDQIAAQDFKLIITVDNGIRNKEEAAYARECGLELIITDHHILPEDRADLPNCPHINPSDSEDNYPWPYLAGVGVAFKLICALLSQAKIAEQQKKLIAEKCLDLVAVGTVADMVNLLGENRLLVKSGLEVLNKNKRLGLVELIKISKINNSRPLEAWNIGWQIGPRLNAASRLAHANSAFTLLTTTDQAEASALAAELHQRNLSRQEITAEISAAVEEQIDPDNLPPLIIGLAGEDQIWNEGVIGLVAGRIADKYHRPTLIITRLVEEAEFDPATEKLVPKKLSFKGSGRSIEGFNMIAAIEDCAELLDKYGGHPMACGFSLIGEEKLEKFKERIIAAAGAKLSAADLIPKLAIDAELAWPELGLDLAEKISALAPFGQNNPQPRFVSYDLRVNDIVTMGVDNQHIKLRLSAAEGEGRLNSCWALAFGAAEEYKKIKIGDRLDLVYYLEINEFNGRREAQLKMIDLKVRK
ncbi:MAG: single-stranded-DNA-specific exonuclease RecJ [Patescibacteria group bacterium]